jgi:L-methionine (R)-S-oxide reductase
MPHKYLIKEFQEFARSASDAKLLMKYVAERIHKHIPRYNWAGFYLLDSTNRSTLVLGPHTGSFTPNPAVPLSHGLCGEAFSNRQVLVVDNVAEDPRYVCASDIVKSHISVPLLVGSKAIGVFSVESYFLATFQPSVEREFVQTCARIVVTCGEHTGRLPFSGTRSEWASPPLSPPGQGL